MRQRIRNFVKPDEQQDLVFVKCGSEEYQNKINVEIGEDMYRSMHRQIVDFTTLKWANISPTNLDMAVDCWGMCWMFAETKYEFTGLSYGQDLMIRRIIDHLQKPAVFFVTTHATPSEEPVDLALTQVVMYYFNGDYKIPNGARDLKECCDIFMEKFTNWRRPE